MAEIQVVEGYTPEKWVYCGRRHSGTKMYHVWRDVNDEYRYYSKLKANSVGNFYWVNVQREGEAVSVLLDVKWTPEAAPDKLALQAVDWQTMDDKRLADAEKRSAQMPLIEEVVEQLLPHVKRFEDLRAINAVIADKLHRAYVARERAKQKNPQ